MRTCIYDYIFKKKCMKCMILVHKIACYPYTHDGEGEEEKKGVSWEVIKKMEVAMCIKE